MFFDTIIHPQTKASYKITSPEGMNIIHTYMSVLDGSYVFNSDLMQVGGGSDPNCTAPTDPPASAQCDLGSVDLQRYRTPCVDIASKKGGASRYQKTRRSKKKYGH